MNIKLYLKGQMELFISIAGVFMVINIILFTSTPLDKSLGEIFYMDLLMIIILAAGVCFHYKQICKNYGEIQQKISQGKDISYFFEKKSNVLGIHLMKELLEFKDKSFSKKEEEYQEKMNDLKDYITQTIHDIKVNIAVCEMVVRRLSSEEEKKSKLIFQIEQLKFRINQVLNITRVNHYFEDIISESVDIEQVIKEAIHDNAEFFMNKGIGIQLHIKPYHFISDKKWVHYIIAQILNNSSKYTNEDGEVTIFSEEDEKAYSLHIRDNGIGIPKEEISRVFDKGFTGSNGRNNTKSTGMGMYYAKTIGNILGIRIAVKSEKGKYTEFVLDFYKLSDYIDQVMK